jgi:hypothetical protein
VSGAVGHGAVVLREAARGAAFAAADAAFEYRQHLMKF